MKRISKDRPYPLTSRSRAFPLSSAGALFLTGGVPVCLSRAGVTFAEQPIIVFLSNCIAKRKCLQFGPVFGMQSMSVQSVLYFGEVILDFFLWAFINHRAKNCFMPVAKDRIFGCVTWKHYLRIASNCHPKI
jgi:hypothetical protein